MERRCGPRHPLLLASKELVTAALVPGTGVPPAAAEAERTGAAAPLVTR